MTNCDHRNTGAYLDKQSKNMFQEIKYHLLHKGSITYTEKSNNMNMFKKYRSKMNGTKPGGKSYEVDFALILSHLSFYFQWCITHMS